jgi:hypothetical protein
VSITGAALGGALVTFTTNVSLAVRPPPSVTVTVIVAVPCWLAAGLRVTVRFVPVPLNVIRPAGKSVRFDDVALSASEPATGRRCRR